MIRFCFKCGAPSPNWKDQKRMWRSPYCTNDCKTAAVNEKRDLKRKSKKCPTCGRKALGVGKVNPGANLPPRNPVMIHRG